jgi:hypothetical protein
MYRTKRIKTQTPSFAKSIAILQIRIAIIGSQQACKLHKLVLRKYILFDNGFLLALTQSAQPSLHVYYIQVRTSNYVLLVQSTIGSLPIFLILATLKSVLLPYIPTRGTGTIHTTLILGCHELSRSKLCGHLNGRVS